MNKPITLDPHVARGQERVFPAQINPATFENENYKNGFSALSRPDGTSQDAEEALACFQKAGAQLPNDPLVRNGMYLAQDILKARHQKEQDEKAQAQQLLYVSVAHVIMGNPQAAIYVIEHAQKLDPGNSDIAAWQRVEGSLETEYAQGNRMAAKFVGNALYFETIGARSSEIQTLKLAEDLYPRDAFVKVMLLRAQSLPDTDASRPQTAP